MYKAISTNKRNTVVMMLVFVAIIGGLGALAGYIYQDWTIVLWVVAVATIYAGIEYFVAGRMAIAMSGGKEITKKDAPELWRVVENLSITEGIPMPRIFIIDDPAPNAFATGRDPEHAMVAATTGLLEIMSKRELEAVMAHEIGHVRNYDILVSMMAYGLVSIIGMLCDLFIRIAYFDDDNDSPMMIFGLIAMIVAPIVASLTRMAISRQREYLADASATMSTRDSEGMIMALEKLKKYSKPMKRQNTSIEHMYISNPLKPGFFSKLFSTHPPIDDRIARLRENANKM